MCTLITDSDLSREPTHRPCAGRAGVGGGGGGGDGTRHDECSPYSRFFFYVPMKRRWMGWICGCV